MRVLVACEFSGVVREAFRALGHDAWSCDLLPAGDKSPFHIQSDALAVLDQGWDLMIGHPPCTYLAASGARWWPERLPQQWGAIQFVKALLAAPIPKIALENPIGILSIEVGFPTQYIQPWQFGHGETKRTCLWLKNLPKLVPTNIVEERKPRTHLVSYKRDRWKERSRTLPGIAQAMAAQWGHRPVIG